MFSKFSIQNFLDGKGGELYRGYDATLAQRIDFAWAVYLDLEKEIPDKEVRQEVQEAALNFLIYAFDISDTQDVNQQLINLMAERQKHQAKNPEYIPNMQPRNLSFDPRNVVLEKIDSKGVLKQPKEIISSIESKELLDLGTEYKEKTDPLYATYLNAEERAKFRVHIRNGVFEKDGRPYDTTDMYSHGRRGYGAYTINANGEISVFTHSLGTDRMFHSSMNAGAPVFAAGELKIKQGVLMEITTSSGHYKPSLFNVQRALDHFAHNNVDISQAQVLTLSDPSSLEGVTSVFNDTDQWITPATQIYKGMNKLIDENIASIQIILRSYTDSGDILDAVFKRTNPALTQKRAELATSLAQEIGVFQTGLIGCTTIRVLDAKVKQLDEIIQKYQDKNSELSRKYGKTDNSGRLAAKLDDFKEKLTDLKAGKPSKNSKEQELVKRMKGLS